MSILRCRFMNFAMAKSCRNFAAAAGQVALKYGENIAHLRKSFERDESRDCVVPVFKRALLYADQIAIKDASGEYSYLQLYMSAKKLAFQISEICGSATSTNVAFLCENNVMGPMVQWACWISGQVALPLNTNCSAELLSYQVEHAHSKLLIATSKFEHMARGFADKLEVQVLIVDYKLVPSQGECVSTFQKQLYVVNDSILISGTLNNDFYSTSNALLLYNAWADGRPVGVMLPHKTVEARISSMVNAWKFNINDTILHIPLSHHNHICISMMICALSVGSRVIMHEMFNSHSAWSTLLGINASSKDRVNVFMAVPRIYNQLINEYDKIFGDNTCMVDYIRNFCKQNFRLIVSSGAHLPPTTYKRWQDITGNNILQCYGTTETGTVISNPYIDSLADGRQRLPGVVGMPLPKTKVRLVDVKDNVLFEQEGAVDKGYWSNVFAPEENAASATMPAIVGKLQVSGPTVFKNYFNQLPGTGDHFAGEFYKTGDIAVFDKGIFSIIGPADNDIIKQANNRFVSTSAIESLLLAHPSIKDATVLGLTRGIYGEIVGVLCIIKPDKNVTFDAMSIYCTDILSSFSLPVILKVLGELPRNEIGETDNNRLLDMVFTFKPDKRIE